MTEKLVSIIIPTYNREYCVSNALDSVAAQTHGNWEALVIDDGSTDGTADLIAQRYGSDPRVKYLYQSNAGVTAARNHGLRTAQGDYIAFLDSDDVWEPWKLELQLACFAAAPDIGMVWTEMAGVNDAGDIVSARYLKTMYRAYEYFDEKDLFTRSYPIETVSTALAPALPNSRLLTGDIFSQMIMGNMVHTSTVVLSRDRLSNVKGFRPDLARTGEDYDFHLRTCREGPVGFVDVASIRYRIGAPDQLTGRTIEVAQNFLKTIEPIIERDRSRIKLPDKMIRRTLAYGHQWLGRELLMSGSRRKARAELAESLHQQWSAMGAVLYLLSILPPGSVEAARSVYGALLKPLLET